MLGFFQEPNNKYDCYAVAAKIKIKRTGIMGIISEDKIVGHVPLEVSRHMYFALAHGCNITGTVMSKTAVRSFFPLIYNYYNSVLRKCYLYYIIVKN